MIPGGNPEKPAVRHFSQEGSVTLHLLSRRQKPEWETKDKNE